MAPRCLATMLVSCHSPSQLQGCDEDAEPEDDQVQGHDTEDDELVKHEFDEPNVVEGSGDDVDVDNDRDQRDAVEGEVTKEDVEFEDVIGNLDVGVLVDRPDHQDDHLKDVEWDEVVFLDNHRRGMSLLTPMATHTGVDLVIQDEMGGVDGVQDDEDDVSEDLEDEFEVVNVA